MPKQLILLMLILSSTVGCHDPNLFADYQDFTDRWPADQKAVFQIDSLGVKTAHLMIYIRNDHRYPFSNLFLIASLKDGDSLLSKDTLEYAMADARGAWLGSGFLEVKESKLWWKENFDLPSSKNLIVELEHAMRYNGTETGINALEGIVGVGFAVEEITQ